MIEDTNGIVRVWRIINGSDRLTALTNALREFKMSTHKDLHDEDLKIALHAVREAGFILANPVYPIQRGDLGRFLMAAILTKGQIDRDVERAAIRVAAKVGRSSRMAGEDAFWILNRHCLNSSNDGIKAAAIEALTTIAEHHRGRLADQICDRLVEFIEKDKFSTGSKTHDAVMKILSSRLFVRFPVQGDLRTLIR